MANVVKFNNNFIVSLILYGLADAAVGTSFGRKKIDLRPKYFLESHEGNIYTLYSILSVDCL